MKESTKDILNLLLAILLFLAAALFLDQPDFFRNYFLDGQSSNALHQWGILVFIAFFYKFMQIMPDDILSSSD